MIDFSDCPFYRVIVVCHPIYHKLKHDLLCFVVFVVLLELLEERGLLFHINRKMSYLVFRIENALNEILSFDVVDCHGVFDDVSGVDDELLGVGHHAEEGKVYD